MRMGLIIQSESLSFSAVFDRVKRKNKNGLETVLTISAQLGLVDPTEYFSRDVSSSDKSNYTYSTATNSHTTRAIQKAIHLAL